MWNPDGTEIAVCFVRMGIGPGDRETWCDAAGLTENGDGEGPGGGVVCEPALVEGNCAQGGGSCGIGCSGGSRGEESAYIC